MNTNDPAFNKILVFDMSNILYRTFYANTRIEIDDAIGLAHHTGLITLNKYFKKYKPTKIIMAFDKPNNWRKAYTLTDECISKKIYKGNRRQKMTATEKAKFERFVAHINDFEEMIRNHTNVICLSKEGLEADDLIAGVTEAFTDSSSIHVVSADKDFIQLLRHKNVTLIDPMTDKPRTLKDWNYDADFFMFEKTLRGDAGDNVQSAYPRLRKTRIEKAYKDEFELLNLLNESWVNQDKKEMKVKDLFNENKLLMDLEEQPVHIKRMIFTTIIEEVKRKKKYSHFHFLKFCGENNLKKVAEQAENFMKMFNS